MRSYKRQAEHKQEDADEDGQTWWRREDRCMELEQGQKRGLRSCCAEEAAMSED